MKAIAKPVEKDALLAELTKDKFVRKTNYGNNDIYIFSAHNSPNLMKEVGRLRELAFRSAGGGTGEEYDIDEYDTCDYPFLQLIVWNKEACEIVGGYRFIDCSKIDIDENGTVSSPTSSLFNLSEKFVKEYIPYTIELGRSWVQPAFQARGEHKNAIFALDNLWDGLGALVVLYPNIKYFFGKVTMYLSYNQKARDLILYFMKNFFPDNDNLVTAKKPLSFHNPESELKTVFTGSNYGENYKILSQQVRKFNENIPPLINSYMSLSPTMKTFGTALNTHFGDVEETGIIIKIADVYDSKKSRHVETFNKNNNI
ncbi:MAG: GNAT family N-acetyltransferase [Paludibacteraceae bacterium]|nr:GNAT family N-acetyltransferase [Paludibacteraceae bacterium]